MRYRVSISVLTILWEESKMGGTEFLELDDLSTAYFRGKKTFACSKYFFKASHLHAQVIFIFI